MQINLLQCCSSADVQENLYKIESQLQIMSKKVDKNEKQLVVLPEFCLVFGRDEVSQSTYAVPSDTSPLKKSLSELARKYKIYLVAGTIPILTKENRVVNRCYFFNDSGQVLGQYDKLHLFDANIKDGIHSYRESDTFCGGDHITVIDTPFGRIGLAVCYDVRFGDLFRAMRLAGAELIALPSAFTKPTGEAHWQTLIQARAIDSQCFLLASAQWGSHNQGARHTWGQSMIVDPWGKILAQKASGEGWVQSRCDLSYLNDIRMSLPVEEHNQFSPPKLRNVKSIKI
ncbi:carbon-nitrogen hydrolase family protein [Microbulbifer epialgicus]|uniref:Carbon-nitrogen hydrolase family protein n=1 Tax=Microbulbifer epialgicus TaxID=393907 RepID=A0ABV4P471_9GAMM